MAGGPLSGLTFAAKDLFDVAGFVTGAGNADYLATHGPAKATASSVQKLWLLIVRILITAATTTIAAIAHSSAESDLARSSRRGLGSFRPPKRSAGYSDVLTGGGRWRP